MHYSHCISENLTLNSLIFLYFVVRVYYFCLFSIKHVKFEIYLDDIELYLLTISINPLVLLVDHYALNINTATNIERIDT